MFVNSEQYATLFMVDPLHDGVPAVSMIDQRPSALPNHFRYHATFDHMQTIEAIKDMIVRGAGAVGAAGGFAMAQAFHEYVNPEQARDTIIGARPTASNLAYAANKVFEAAINSDHPKDTAFEMAQLIALEDATSCEQIGKSGAELIEEDITVMTHCNAGWLAFVDWGSALSPIYKAQEQGRSVRRVIADKTGPRDQGGKLTAWELKNQEIPHVIAEDTMMAHCLENEGVDLIIVGADRIAANGDVANKIGTHLLAIAANHFEIPFYVAAPLSTFDLKTSHGTRIDIEKRDDEEVTHRFGFDEDGKFRGVMVTNPGSEVINPSFDVTPAGLITGIITSDGIIREPNTEKIAALL